MGDSRASSACRAPTCIPQCARSTAPRRVEPRRSTPSPPARRYLNDEEKTRATFTEDGWLKTGDIARIDEDDCIFITGRIKELIITAGGENIPPLLIEGTVKKLLPCVSQCVLIGENRNLLSGAMAMKQQLVQRGAEAGG